MTDFSISKTVVARKKHKCCECHGLIEIGESYEKDFIVQDSYPSSFKTCKLCVSYRDWLIKETDWPDDIDGEGHSFYYGMLHNHLLEQAREGDKKYSFTAYRLSILMNKRIYL